MLYVVHTVYNVYYNTSSGF